MLLNLLLQVLTPVKWGRLICLLALCVSVFLKPNRLRADHDSTQITNLKATFIVNTLNYIRWQDRRYSFISIACGNAGCRKR